MIPVQKVLVRYTVTTGVLEYAVPFALYGTGDVNVSWATAGDTETQTRLAPGSDYSVTVFRDMTGGKVTLADGKVPAGATLAIESAVPLTQELDLSNTATVDTEATEGQLDRMVQMIQQLGDGLSRAVKVNATDSGTPEDLLGSLYKARDDAKDAATAATASEQAAEGSEQAAATSALQAASSEQAAATSAEAADQSQAEAAASAAAASQSATAARQSAEAAAGSEDRAAQSAASILGLQVEVATLDPGLPASGDYDPETGILHLGIPKGDSGASAIATPTSLGSVMPQTGDEDGLTLEKDGTLRVRKATTTQRGGVLASKTVKAEAVPLGGADGTIDKGWIPIILLNSHLVITESNPSWTSPVTGWARVTAIGGGGGGCAGHGDAGGAYGGGGGAGGEKITSYMYLNKGTTYPVVIGAGGTKGDVWQTGGTAGGQSSFGELIAKGGNPAKDSTGGKGTLYSPPGTNGQYNNFPAAGGDIGAKGGVGGGYGYGIGGHGATGRGGGGSDDNYTDGAQGAVIIEYYDPDKEDE